MPTDSSRQLVVFSLGDEEYALPITQVHEIIRWIEPRSVASDHAWVRGVISLRGKIVPVHDLAVRLGLHAERPAHAKIVIVEMADGVAGVIVDDVEEVLTVDADQLDTVPTAGDPAIEGIAKIGQRLVVVLDPQALFGRATALEVAEAA